MKSIKWVVVAMSLAFVVGCGKGDDKKAGGDKTPAAAPAGDKAAPAGDKAAPAGDKAAPAGNEPVICCEFNGAAGTSTKSKCDEFKGTVVDDSKCKK